MLIVIFSWVWCEVTYFSSCFQVFIRHSDEILTELVCVKKLTHRFYESIFLWKDMWGRALTETASRGVAMLCWEEDASLEEDASFEEDASLEGCVTCEMRHL